MACCATRVTTVVDPAMARYANGLAGPEEPVFAYWARGRRAWWGCCDRVGGVQVLQIVGVNPDCLITRLVRRMCMALVVHEVAAVPMACSGNRPDNRRWSCGRRSCRCGRRSCRCGRRSCRCGRRRRCGRRLGCGRRSCRCGRRSCRCGRRLGRGRRQCCRSRRGGRGRRQCGRSRRGGWGVDAGALEDGPAAVCAGMHKLTDRLPVAGIRIAMMRRCWFSIQQRRIASNGDQTEREHQHSHRQQQITTNRPSVAPPVLC